MPSSVIVLGQSRGGLPRVSVEYFMLFLVSQSKYDFF
jgi:hypothetical protein